MTSREKVLALRQHALTLKPPDEETAQQLQLLVAFSPALIKALPEDPEELDFFLERMATWALACRGDGADVLAVHRWDPEEERWKEPA